MTYLVVVYSDDVTMLLSRDDGRHAYRPAEEAFGKVARGYKQQREMKQKQGGMSDDEDLIVFAVVDAANAV